MKELQLPMDRTTVMVSCWEQLTQSTLSPVLVIGREMVYTCKVQMNTHAPCVQSETMVGDSRGDAKPPLSFIKMSVFVSFLERICSPQTVNMIKANMA